MVAMEDVTPLQAFRRVCNLRMLAVVYYFCLLHAVSRSLTWFGRSKGSRCCIARLRLSTWQAQRSS